MFTTTNRRLCRIAFLSVLITLSGMFKLPSFLPGSEFQLSAPIAVAICGSFGIGEYIYAGLISSILGLLLGTQHVLNVGIALIFRVVVAIVFYYMGPSRLFYTLSGPLGTLVARLSLALVIGKAAYPLVLAAAPGMLFTAVTAPFLGRILTSLKERLALAKLQ